MCLIRAFFIRALMLLNALFNAVCLYNLFIFLLVYFAFDFCISIAMLFIFMFCH